MSVRAKCTNCGYTSTTQLCEPAMRSAVRADGGEWDGNDTMICPRCGKRCCKNEGKLVVEHI